jgi:hypothetical protein
MKALERWLIAAGILSSTSDPGRLRRWRDSPAAESVLKKLHAFREKLRAEMLRQERGLPISEAFLEELNRLLVEHPSRMAVQRQWRLTKSATAGRSSGSSRPGSGDQPGDEADHRQ